MSISAVPALTGPSSARLLQLAVPLVHSYGFTREALARSVLSLPPSEAHSEPLPDSAVSALFGHGSLAQRRLIHAWLDEGVRQIKATPPGLTLKHVLSARLQFNEPVLHHLPEAFAMLALPSSGLPPVDPRPAFHHASRIADEACYVTGDASLQLAWYARRASVAAIYTAAELHQLTSPKTTYEFLDSLLLERDFEELRCALDGSGYVMVSIVTIEFPLTYHGHSIIIDAPIADVFSIIGTSVGVERVARLSGICSAFTLLKADTVTVPSPVSLADTHVRLTSSSEAQPPSSSERLLPRQFFALTETVDVLFGLIKTSVSLAGTLTWDEEAKLALYESESTSGISVKVWKLRRFEEVEGNRTRVSETIQGRCPFWITSIVRKEGTSQHLAHMESYPTLFE